MEGLLNMYSAIVTRLNAAGDWIGLLGLRLILGWEFFEAGLMKFNGENWFSGIQDNFPFPFNVIPPDISWFMATWSELIGGVALWLGAGTRFFAATLMILTVVATLAVHWPEQWNTLAELWKGYAVSDKGFGNFKLPLLFFLMLIPLFFYGAGKLSVDNLLSRQLGR